MQIDKLNKYINNFIGNDNFSVSKIKGDASNRKYYRVRSKKRNLILMDSSLEKRNYNNFLKFTEIFKKNKICIPKILNKNLNKKFLVMEDLGNNLIYDKANKIKDDKIYKKAIFNIIKIQEIKNRNIKKYTKEKYFKESFLFLEWVLKKFLLLKVSKKDSKKLSDALNFIVDNIEYKNFKLVHRDYHSKNLFYKNKKIVIIDYQDALYGSPLYDLVSIINDCYRDIGKSSKNQFLKLFLSFYNEYNLKKFSEDELLHNYHLITVQRHLKASGIFCRLSVRNNRHNYLQHLSRTLNYIVNASSNYGNLEIINMYAKEVLEIINESDYSSRRQR